VQTAVHCQFVLQVCHVTVTSYSYLVVGLRLYRSAVNKVIYNSSLQREHACRVVQARSVRTYRGDVGKLTFEIRAWPNE
jgi:hypothetical protein